MDETQPTHNWGPQSRGPRSNPKMALKRIGQVQSVILLLVGGLEHGFYDFPYIGNNDPNWRTHIFQRDCNHQPGF